MTDSPPGQRRRALGCLFEIVETVVLTVVIFLGIQTFVAQPYQVEMRSMETTLLPGQYVLVDKLSPRWAPYARGDIVIFHPPDAFQTPDDTPFIKRVIGLPGDQVELRDGRVSVNGVELDEAYVHEAETDAGEDAPTSWLVPAGSLFVMGDHRSASEDSRVFGPIEISRVVGRAFLRYWPLDTFGMLETPTYAGLGE